MAKDLNRHLIEGDIHMANKYMKRCPISFVIWEIPIEKIWDTTTHILEWLKSKELIIPIPGGMWSNRNSHSLLMGIQNGTVTLKDCLAVSYKAN